MKETKFYLLPIFIVSDILVDVPLLVLSERVIYPFDTLLSLPSSVDEVGESALLDFHLFSPDLQLFLPDLQLLLSGSLPVYKGTSHFPHVKARRFQVF